jgi:D-xylose 1-dehydrogenase (NADP+, D-xylono-1,5-lactone-forming)
MSVDPVRWGILSTAHINEKVLAGAAGTPTVEVVAVGSRSVERAQEFADRHGIPRAHGSYEELLADPEVEAVYISLPNTLHVEWSIKALEAGKHVLCEKPFDRNPENVARAFDVSERTGRLLTEAFMYRHSPQTKTLRELVASGAIGELRLIRSCFSYSLYDADNIRLRTEVEGGALMDVGCYCVSGSRLLAGEPDRVHAEAWYGPTGTDWVFAGVLHFPNDVLATFDCGTALPNRDELEAIGSEGSLFVDDPWHCRRPGIELRRGVEVERIEIEPADSYRLELENLSDAIRGVGEPLLGREDAVGNARAIEALANSAEKGVPVKL